MENKEHQPEDNQVNEESDIYASDNEESLLGNNYFFLTSKEFFFKFILLF